MTDDLRKTWAILTATEKRRAAWMLFLIAVMAGAELIGVLSIMPFLSVLGRPEVIHENSILDAIFTHFRFRSDRDFLVALGLASIAMVVGASGLKAVTLHLINRFVHFLRHSISARLLSRYLHQPYEFYLEHNPTQLSRNVLSEVDQLLFGLIHPISQMLAQGTLVVAMTALIFWYDPLSAVLIVSVIGLLYATIYGSVRKRIGHIGKERQIANGRRFQACNEAVAGIKDVKITHAAATYQSKFNSASRDLSRHMAAGDTLAQAPLYIVETVGYSGLIIIALTLMLRRNDIALVLPAIGLYGFAAYRMLPAAQIMYRGLAKLKFSSAALDIIHRDLMLPEQKFHTEIAALTPRREVRLNRVTYAYPSHREKLVLDHFDLVIPAGTSLGIKGPSGAGKSTLMDIILGLLAPQSGTLSIDDTPIGSHNVVAWQRSIGYVPQHIYLADATVAENIAFGVPRELIDMAAVRRAAQIAQAHHFIVNELELGYDTRLGDRGIRLSGGQRQRIGIARALYRDPPVLLMDEATSALDIDTENAFHLALARLSGTKTIILITHDEESLRTCDRVILV